MVLMSKNNQNHNQKKRPEFVLVQISLKSPILRFEKLTFDA